MKILSIAFMTLLLISCKKNNNEIPAGDPNQRVSADINLAGSNSHLAATGNYTGFTKAVYPNSVTMINDTVITILGSVGTQELQINLGNVNSTGTYQFGQYPGRSYLMARYTPNRVGFGGGDYYFNHSAVLSGTINITSFTATHIEGSFVDSCWNGTTAASITNGSFSGNF